MTPVLRRVVRAGIAVSGAAILTLGAASPALGHQGHGSCAPGAQGFTVPLAQSGGMGELASTTAQEEGGVGETSQELHEAGCEPRP